MFVLNPDPYLLPDYKISPFETTDIRRNNELPADNSIDNYFSDRFPGRNFIYTINGRSALNIALSNFNLSNDDVVTVLTTSGNRYISGCVTSEIEKFCSWNRTVEPETKVILVIHEFGFPYQDLKSLKKYGLPIIEDSAYSFFSQDPDNTINNVGDFVIFSFPKMFPLQIGGLLLYNDQHVNSEAINSDELEYIKKVLSYYITRKDSIIEKRVANYNLIKEKLLKIGLEERFKINSGIVPGVYMFKDPHGKLKLEQLKSNYFAHGVQCSMFYGEQSFFLPIHQNLSTYDIEYFLGNHKEVI